MGIKYEVVNPSDQVTFIAPDVISAAIALSLVGNGQYSATALDPNDRALDIPFFMFGGLQSWLEENGEELNGITNRHLDNTATALESFCTGTLMDRELYELSLASITDEEKRAKFIMKWDDKKRSSMNDITNRANQIAAKLRMGGKEAC